MPILDVELVGKPTHDSDSIAQRLADAAAQALEARPGSVWVKLRWIEGSCYAESAGAPAGLRPVFVKLLRKTRPEGDALVAEIARLTAAVAAVCDRPAENVHVLYEGDAAGRLAFGGRLVR